MRTLPRHLLLAAVLLTVCCAERQAATAGPTSSKEVPKLADQVEQVRYVTRQHVRRSDRHRFIRPAVPAFADAPQRGFGHSCSLIRPESPVVHVSFPPSRFRLPPPSVLA